MIRTTSCTPLMHRTPLGPWLGALAGALLGAFTLEPTARAESVLVYEIEDTRVRGGLADEALAELTSYLTAKLGSGTTFTPIARDRVVAGVKDEGKEGAGPCFEELCQITLARELGASLLLSTQILRTGDHCAVSSLLVDANTRAVERGASAMGGCTRPSILGAVERVVVSLKRQTKAAGGDSSPDEDDHVPEPEGFVAERERAPAEDLSAPVVAKAELSPADQAGCDHGDGAACGRAAWGASDAGQRALAERYGQQGCRLGDGASCRWAAKLASERRATKEALEYARRGCRVLADGGSCGWGASIQYELGERRGARELAKRGCELGDPEACSWVAKLDYDEGKKGDALSLTQSKCRELRHGASCRWAASIAYENGERASALEYAELGCGAGDGSSCAWASRVQYEDGKHPEALLSARKGAALEDGDAWGWVAKLEYDDGKKGEALSAARHGCEQLRHGASCSWAASISVEQGDAARAREYAKRGALAGDPDALSWAAKLESEAGNKKRALDYARRGCVDLHHGPSCRWAASFEYEAGHKAQAGNFAGIGCNNKDGAACSWVARVEYELDHHAQALTAAAKGCELRDADGCSWAAKIESETGSRGKALEYATRGCALDNADACAWKRSLLPPPSAGGSDGR